MADVFISYCRSEGTSELVRRIAGELGDMGISCWYDTQGLNIGEIGSFIKTEIEQCKVFLLLLDVGANQSSYVFSEVCASFPLYRKQIAPIPVQIGSFKIDDSLWFRFSGYNILSYVSPDAVPVKELTRKIAELLRKTPQLSVMAQLPQVTQLPPERARTVERMRRRPIRDIISGSCGNHVTFTLDVDLILKRNDAILTISGNGSMWNAVASIKPEPLHVMVRRARAEMMAEMVKPFDNEKYGKHWRNYVEQISHIVIESGVTAISEFAFSGCINLTSVTIPNSVNLIGNRAFYDCKRLTNISVPENAIIGYDAFPEWTTVTRRES